MNRDDTPTSIRIAGTPVDDDRVAAVYRCHRQLVELQDTDNLDVKYCDTCRQKVFRVQDFDGLERAIASRGCVWGPIDMAFPKKDSERCFLGGPAIEYAGASLLSWDD